MMKPEIKTIILEELKKHPTSAVEMLNLITAHLNDSIAAAKRVLDREARTGLEMAIGTTGKKLPPNMHRAVLGQMFKAYGKAVDGDSKAVKDAWKFYFEDGESDGK